MIYESENPKNKKEELFFNAYKECRSFALVFDTYLIGCLTDGVIKIGHRLDTLFIDGENNIPRAQTADRQLTVLFNPDNKTFNLVVFLRSSFNRLKSVLSNNPFSVPCISLTISR